MTTTIDQKLYAAASAYKRARREHKDFALEVTDKPGAIAARDLFMLHAWNDKHAPDITAESVLAEEVAEIYDAYANATPEDALSEIYDAIAVLLRMADMVEQEVY